MLESTGFDTKLIHAGEPSPRHEGAVTLPIYQSSTFEYSGADDYDSIRYIRLNNTPNHVSLGRKLAEIEGTEAGMVTASGMAAISTALLALIPEGGHLLAQDNLYGGTYHFLKENFAEMGRKITFFPLSETHRLESFLTPTTRGIYVESVSNPLLKVPDLAAIVRFAKERGLTSFIDNTFPSPVNFNPAGMGFDIVLHSATKYLNGHSDIVGGAILGEAAALKKIVKLLNHLGPCMDPHTCFLLARGMKTLGLRVRRQNETALALARALEEEPLVRKVFYPGLESHPDHARSREYFRGFGGMLALELHGDAMRADAFLHRLTLAVIAPSLGGPETLVTRPATTSHSGMQASDRAQSGISDSLIRVSVGLEDAADLIADFKQALA